MHIRAIKEEQLLPPAHTEDEDHDPFTTATPPTTPFTTTYDPNEGNPDNIDIYSMFTDSPQFWNGQLPTSPMTHTLAAQLISPIRPHTAA